MQFECMVTTQTDIIQKWHLFWDFIFWLSVNCEMEVLQYVEILLSCIGHGEPKCPWVRSPHLLAVLCLHWISVETHTKTHCYLSVAFCFLLLGHGRFSFSYSLLNYQWLTNCLSFSLCQSWQSQCSKWPISDTEAKALSLSWFRAELSFYLGVLTAS